MRQNYSDNEVYKDLSERRQSRENYKFKIEDLRTLYQSELKEEFNNLWTEFLRNKFEQIVRADRVKRKELYISFIDDLLQETQKREPYKDFYSKDHCLKKQESLFDLNEAEQSIQYDSNDAYQSRQIFGLLKRRRL